MLVSHSQLPLTKVPQSLLSKIILKILISFLMCPFQNAHFLFAQCLLLLLLVVVLLLLFCNLNNVTFGVFAQFWNNLYLWPKVCQWLVSHISISLPWAGSLHTAEACSSKQCMREWDWASAAGCSSDTHPHESPTACRFSQSNGHSNSINDVVSYLFYSYSRNHNKALQSQLENNRSTLI